MSHVSIFDICDPH